MHDIFSWPAPPPSFVGHPVATQVLYAALGAVLLWSLVWKGIALWYAGRGGQKVWFIFLLIVNTLGILEITYLIWFRPRSFELEKPGMDSSTAS